MVQQTLKVLRQDRDKLKAERKATPFTGRLKRFSLAVRLDILDVKIETLQWVLGEKA